MRGTAAAEAVERLGTGGSPASFGSPGTKPAFPRRACDVTDRIAFGAELRFRRRRAMLAARRAVEGRSGPALPAFFL